MAAPSALVRRAAIQKNFWLRKGLNERLVRVVRAKRKRDGSFTERRAFALAVRDYVEQEERSIAAATGKSAGELATEIGRLSEELRIKMEADRGRP